MVSIPLKAHPEFSSYCNATPYSQIDEGTLPAFIFAKLVCQMLEAKKWADPRTKCAGM